MLSSCSRVSPLHKKKKVERILCYNSDKKNYSICCLIGNDLHLIIDRCKTDDSFERALTYYMPSMVLLSSRHEFEIEICELRQLEYELKPNMDFNSDNGLRSLDQRCKKTREEIEFMVSFEQYLVLTCCSVLFSYTDSQGSTIDIDELIESEIDNLMLLNEDALLSLDIFYEEHHPNQNMQKSKESLSLFGIFNHTKSSYGCKTLNQWFRCPSTDKAIIMHRQAAVEELLLAKHQKVFDKLRKALSIKSPQKVMKEIAPGSSHHEWKALLGFCESVFKIHQFIQEMTFGNPNSCLLLLNKELDVKSLKDVSLTIIQVVDFEKSSTENRVCVKTGLDPQLDEIRNRYDTISSELTRASEELLTRYVLSSMFPFAETLNVVYFPQLGFLTCLTFSNNVFPDAEILDQSPWNLQFESQNGIYFKNEQMVEMDDQIGDIQQMLVEKEIDILYQLIVYIRLSLDILIKAEKSCGIIDALASLAVSAKLYNLSKPTIVDEMEITFKEGRHLLQEMCVSQFITNDFTTKDINKCILITGPNNSGKSVILKQIGILSVLSQIGSFVPCSMLRISIFDRILTRIKSVESVSRQKSSFMIDLQQIGYSIRNATNALVLFDEFGKGTRNQDGIGLLASTIKHFQQMDHFGFLFATTHHLEVYKYLEHLKVEFYKMTTVKNANGTLTFIYHLEPGSSLSSYGIECAKSVGMPDEFIDKAFKYFTAIQNETAIHLEIEQDDLKMNRVLTALGVMALESEEDVEELRKLFLSN
eukprot:NODE_63_length_25098_cov_0.440498.p2 type:complete len:759 gc:universal NODE_63_length_25098_cov_0.440498:21490-23766(+)